jgi:glycosyltransferase involved in cell wall biosynthesis
MPVNNKLKVAHLVSHPIQYYVPLFREISRRPEIDLTVYYYSADSLREYFDPGFGREVKWDVPLTGGYQYVFDQSANERKPIEGFDWRPSWSILRELAKKKFDVIWLNGYMFANSWMATLLSRIQNRHVLLRDDQTLLTPRSRSKRLVKRLVLPLIFKRISGLYVGESNRAFFEHYGTPQTFRVAHSVDNEMFAGYYRRLHPSRNALRTRFGVSGDDPVILFSGKLIDKKQPQLLLEAFRLVRQASKCHLLFVGDGALRESLQATVQTQAIPDVHFVGFLNQTELPAAYTAADILVLPSAYQETWGLVVNEAMNFELPIVVSDRVGCAADLVEEGRNGIIFKSGDVQSLAKALQALVAAPETRRAYGQRSSEIIKNYSVEHIASQLVTACQAAAGAMPQSVGLSE